MATYPGAVQIGDGGGQMVDGQAGVTAWLLGTVRWIMTLLFLAFALAVIYLPTQEEPNERTLAPQDLAAARLALPKDGHLAAPSGQPVEQIDDAPEGSGWFKDPTLRHELRWFDGHHWGVIVRDGDTTDADSF